MKKHILRFLSALCVLTAVASAEEPGALFDEAESLARSRQNEEAMAKVEEAVAEIDRIVAEGGELSWQARNGLRFAARLAREDFLDYEKALTFSDKLFDLADTDYWRVPARLDRALTYRARGDYDRAGEEYDEIAEAEPGYALHAAIPKAEMVYFDMNDESLGRELLIAALNNEAINGRERFNALKSCVGKAVAKGRREEAIQWYGLLENMPFENDGDRAKYLSQAWYETGLIEESLGETKKAESYYRRAMESDDGEMRYRVRARDALESLEYFE